MTEREQKALIIAAKSRIIKMGKSWFVPSQSSSDQYKIDSELQHCTCPDHQTNQVRCKHILAVEIVIEREQSTKTTAGSLETTTTVTETVKLRYNQMWSAYNSAQTNEKAKFLELLHALCSNVDEPIQTIGRTRLPMSDMLFATTFKVYEAVSSRRFMSDLKDVYARRYISKMPCYNSINGYIEKEELTPYLQWLITQSALPLKSVETNFAVDSSGFSTCQYIQMVRRKVW